MTISIFNARIIDGTGAPAIENGSLVTEGEFIIWVGKTVDLPEPYLLSSLNQVDLIGKTIMPGVVDAHTHVSFGEAMSEEELALYTPVEFRSIRAGVHAKWILDSGVTSISDSASTFNISVAVRDAVESGWISGPRISSAGRQLTSHQGLEDAFPSSMEFPAGQAGVLVRGREEIIEAIRLQVKDGVDVIKVSGSGDSAVNDGPLVGMAFRQEEFDIIADETHRLGKHCTVHARTAESVKASARAGFDWIMHASYIDNEGIELCLQKGITLVPTITLLVNIIEFGTDSVGASFTDVFKREVEAASENLSRAYKQGVKLAAGSEAGWAMTPFGEWHMREVALMNELFGLDPLQAIRSATLGAAITVPRWRDQIGALRKGMLADFLVIDGRPDDNLSILQDPSKIVAVYKGGSAVERSPRQSHERFSWEKTKVYINGRYRRDPSSGRGFINRI